MRSVTKIAIKEARLKEIKQELLKSQQLKVSLYLHTNGVVNILTGGTISF